MDREGCVRKRYALLVFPIALIAVTTMSVTGQEEPLPAVTPRLAANAASPETAPIRYVALAVEPVRALATPTLEEAARRHDYVTFHALYLEAKAAGENVSAFDALHDLWTWSMSDPIGAFYGAEMHARLSRAYPGFARYIDDHRIIDSRGGVFYPTSETRTFLLERAVEGRTPRVLIAETPRSTEASRSAESRTSPARTPASTGANPAPAPARRTAATSAPAAARTAKVAPAKAAPATAPETKVAAAPPVTTPLIAAAPVVPAPGVTNVPAASTITSSVAPTDATPTASAPADAAPATPAQTAVPTSEQVATSQASQPIARDGGFANRGILLLVIGIVGIGLLAVMLRTPQETSMPSILQPPTVPPAEKPATQAADGAAPVAPVEPLRRPSKGGAKRAS